MKKFIAAFVLLFICTTIFAQKKWIIISATDNSGKADTLRYGDFVKVKMKNGHKFVGNIPDVEADYFLVNRDTVRVNQISKIAFETRHPGIAGKVIMIIGGAVAVSGIGFVVLAFNTNNSDGLGYLVYGVLTAVTGILVTGVGVIVNASERHSVRKIGKHYLVKIT